MASRVHRKPEVTAPVITEADGTATIAPGASVQAIVDICPAAAAILDDSGIIVQVNESWRRTMQRNPAGAQAEAVGLHFSRFYGSGDHGREVLGCIESVVSGKQTEAYLPYFCTSSGAECRCDVLARRLEMSGVPHVFVCYREIDVGPALQESAERFRLMADAAPVMVWMSGPDKLCTYLNKSWLKFTGRTLEQELGAGWASGVHPDDYEACLKTYAEAFEARQPFTMEYRLRRFDGQYRWILDKGTARYYANGEFAGYIGSCVEIHDHKQAEEELRANSERLRLAMEAGKSGGWEWDLKTGRNVWFGDMHALMGTSAETYSEKIEEFRRLVHPDDVEKVQVTTAVSMREHAPYHAEFRIVRPDGTVRWQAARGKFFYSPAGQAERMLGIAVDITDRKQAEESTQIAERRYADLVSTIDAVVWRAAVPSLQFTFVSKQAEKLLGYPLEHWTNQPDFRKQHTHPEDYQPVCAAFDRAMQTLGADYEYRIIAADGGVVWVRDLVRVITDDGKPSELVGVTVDISPRKRSEQALRDLGARLINAQEEERCRIARELHDDLNQRLGVLAIELQHLGQKLPQSATELGRRLHELWTRTTEISSDIGRMSHRLHSSKLDYLGLGPAITGLCQEMNQQYGVNVKIACSGLSVSLPEDVALCLFRVVQESLRNTITHSGAKEAEVEVTGSRDGILLRVADSGCGFDIEAAHAKRGLGLVSMRERLRLVGGELVIRSRPGEGTEIRVHVPLRTRS